MSDVPKNKRSHSKLHAQHLTFKLRNEITTALMTTFGYSQKKFERHLNKVTAYIGDPAERLEAKTRLQMIEDNFDVWYIDEERHAVLALVREISHHIRAANTIYPQYKAEFYERRLEWDRAMAACNKLQDELQHIAETLPADKNKYMNIVLNVEHIYNELHALRKSDNKRFLPHLKE